MVFSINNKPIYGDYCIKSSDSIVVRELAFHQFGSGSIPVLSIVTMWVKFVGSLLCSERFSLGNPVLPSPQKPSLHKI